MTQDSISFLESLTRLSRRTKELVLASKPKCHFAILHRVAKAIETDGHDASISVSELTRVFEASPQAVSRGLRILEQDGLVERCPDVSDRRKMTVRLTPEGKQAHDECEAAMMKYGCAVAERLGPERLQRMREDLNALLEAMEAEANCQGGSYD